MRKVTLPKVLLLITVLWAAGIGLIVTLAERFPVLPPKAFSSESSHLYFGYIMSGRERFLIFNQNPLPLPMKYELTWVDWPSREEQPFWLITSFDGYGVVRGQLEVAEIEKYGHFGMSRAILKSPVSVIPPLPITVFSWLAVMLGVSVLWFLARLMRKYWIRIVTP